jgi:hypothetical protein
MTILDDYEGTALDYEGIKSLSKETKRSVEDLLVLCSQNDPFYADMPYRRRAAEWFAALWQEYGFGVGTHIRRIHYRIISQSIPVMMPDGATRYENTKNCSSKLIDAARDARYLGLVRIEEFVDRKNKEAIIGAQIVDRNADVDIYDTWDEATFPDPPSLYLQQPIISQRYHIALVVEKTTMDDIIEPFAQEYGIALYRCSGEISLTRCYELLQRAKVSGKPTIVLYISDFDPAGLSMPVACARKIEFLIRRDNLDIELQLRPVVLTKEQCEHYQLPRTPIKDGEKRAEGFEARYGEGATELDALEALHSGELHMLLVAEIERYYDTNLTSEIASFASDIEGDIEGINKEILAEYQPEIDALSSEMDALNEKINSLWQEHTN